MELTRLAADAGQFIKPGCPSTRGGDLGQADRTELDPGLEELLALADATKTCTDKIVSQTEVLLQPNPGSRFEDRLYEQLDWRIPSRPRAQESLGEQMIQAGLEMGPNTPYGKALLRCGEAQKQLGEAERKFVQSTNILFLTPLRNFTDAEYRSIQDERRMLLNKRLDLDIAKTRLKKAHEAESEATNLNMNPVETDYLSQVSFMFSFLRVRWLKMWAQEISQAEMELRICESLFRRQSEVTRQVVEGIGQTHTHHMQILTDFVEAQASYFDQCNQHTQDLQKHLASIPAVLCSNNWQSAGGSEVSQQSCSNHVANEPGRLHPHAINVHRLPEFDQDSWTVNAPPGTEKTSEDVPPLDLHNNNNNNNTLTPGQAIDQESDLEPCPADPISSLRTTEGAGAAATGGARTHTTMASPSERSGTSNEAATTDMTAVTVTTNCLGENQPINEAQEPAAINGEGIQESSTSGGDVAP
uniref:SH3-domain GRB2-like endophilin B1b n=2 Tax=Takifugu rubripes TaxID=31033 RepID=A0A3B5KSL9_TAKRU